MIATFFKTYKAEGIKLKNTYIYILSIILSLIIPTFFLVYSLINLSDLNKEIYLGFNIFEYTFDRLSGSYLGFFYIITLIIVSSKLAQVDYKNNTWQLIETLPITKFNIYFSKVLRIISVSITALLSFIISCIFISILLYAFLSKKAEISLDLPFILYFKYFIKTIIASLFAISVLFFISVRFSNFIFTMLFGFALLIANPILRFSEKLPKWDMYKLINNVAYAPSDIGNWFTYSDYVSVLLAIPVFILGYLWYKDKTFKSAFISNKKQSATFVVICLLFLGSAAFLLSPNQQLPSNKTSVVGTVYVDFPIKKAFLIDPVLDDTLAVSTIQDGKFVLNVNQNIPLGEYYVRIDNKIETPIFMGNNDLIDFEYKKQGDKNKIKVLGTRLAENSIESGTTGLKRLSYYIDNNERLEDTEYYFNEIKESYNLMNKRLRNTYTADNYIPRNDYFELQNKINALEILNSYNSYESKYKLTFNKPLPDNKFISDLKSSIKLDDATLVTTPNYIEFIKHELIKVDTSAIDEETKYINQLISIPNSEFKDRLIYDLAIKNIVNTKSIAKIEASREQFENQFYNPKIKKNFEAKLHSALRMASGNQAPIFDASDNNGMTYKLSDFDDRYVVLDIWATWCGPCKVQSPMFDKVANSYKDNANVIFIALSVDEKKDKWLTSIAGKKVNVSQMHATNLDEFSSQYNITTIPRFVLIGKNGVLLNSNLPFPDTDEFEEVLQKEIK